MHMAAIRGSEQLEADEIYAHCERYKSPSSMIMSIVLFAEFQPGNSLQDI